MTAACAHLDSVELTELPDSIAGCEDCLAIGGSRVHLRVPRLWSHRALRRLAAPARGRRLELVLRRQRGVRGRTVRIPAVQRFVRWC